MLLYPCMCGLQGGWSLAELQVDELMEVHVCFNPTVMPASQSWGTRPLSAAEDQQLQRAADLGGYLCSALPLVAHELRASAAQLSFLYGGMQQKRQIASPSDYLDPDLAIRYGCAAAAGGWWGGANPRALLTPGEHRRLLHVQVAPSGPPTAATSAQAWPFRRGLAPLIDVPSCPVAAGVVVDYEAALAQLVVQPMPANTASSPPAYPLAPDTGAGEPVTRWFKHAERAHEASTLESAMHAELAASWAAHHVLQEPDSVKPGAREEIIRTQVLSPCASNLDACQGFCPAVLLSLGCTKYNPKGPNLLCALVHTILTLASSGPFHNPQTRSHSQKSVAHLHHEPVLASITRPPDKSTGSVPQTRRLQSRASAPLLSPTSSSTSTWCQLTGWGHMGPSSGEQGGPAAVFPAMHMQ